MKYDKELYTIKQVRESKDWYEITTAESTGFGLKKKWGKVPKVGDTVTLYTKGFSYIVGIDLNGERCFLFSEEELEQHRQEELACMEREKQDRYAQNKEIMDAQYAALPEAFRQRIDRFRADNDRFRIDYESYELFCCEQAVLIADACKTAEKVLEFKGKEWEEQAKMVPGLSDGHSGNTFGCAVALAYWYLTDENVVGRLHGALSPLVGSEEYGDTAKN